MTAFPWIRPGRREQGFIQPGTGGRVRWRGRPV